MEIEQIMEIKNKTDSVTCAGVAELDGKDCMINKTEIKEQEQTEEFLADIFTILRDIQQAIESLESRIDAIERRNLLEGRKHERN